MCEKGRGREGGRERVCVCVRERDRERKGERERDASSFSSRPCEQVSGPQGMRLQGMCLQSDL